MKRVAAVAVGVAICVAGLLWAFRAPAIPTSALAIRAEGPGGAGLALLLSDLTEEGNRRIVVPTGTPIPPGAHLLQVRLARTGDTLSADAVLDGRPLPHRSGTPAQVLAGLAATLGLEPPGPSIMPTDPSDGFQLLDLAGRTQDDANAALVAEAQALVARNPKCASARLALATLLTRYLVEHVDLDTLEAQQACEQNFQEGLAILPAYPRFAGLYAIHLSDIRRQPEALRLLQGALKRHPGNATLLNALAYAARTCGLLDLADRALQRRSALADLPRGQANLADNTLLYEGRYQAFEAGLTALPPGPLQSFYQGYARLIQGDPERARPFFEATRSGGLGSTLFVRLAGVYRLALEGRKDEANRMLDALDAERVHIRLPDGEFTFKVAEAYGYLGRPGDALEAAERASVQGFGCTAWYERAPFLADARKLPRWPSLDQHLRERQRLLETGFPASSFAL